MEEVGWVERKGLVKTELLLNGGRACGGLGWGAEMGEAKVLRRFWVHNTAMTERKNTWFPFLLYESRKSDFSHCSL